MPKRTKLLCVVGTRPEVIKMAPLILRLQNETWCDTRILATAQHRQTLDQMLAVFGIKPHIDLDIMRTDQTLSTLTSSLLQSADEVLLAERPDAVLVQGDTTTAMSMALACFYRNIRVGHVEAGLRTGDLQSPFPEEANRVIISKLSRWHFAPTASARLNLLTDGVANQDILVTGNTVIDALLMTASQNPKPGIDLPDAKRLVVVTVHRRENFGDPLREICRALLTLAQRNPNVHFLYPVHPNPNVKDVAYEILSGCQNFQLCQPLDYASFVAVMQRAYLIMTDSGGIQEEAPALGKPVLVLRNETERPEAVDSGAVKLVGPSFERIVEETQKLLDDQQAYASMAGGGSPFGDGQSAGRIVAVLRRDLC